MNSPPESSSDLEQISSTQISTLEEVVEEERLDFIDDAARLDPKECVKRLGSPQGNIFHFAARKGKAEFMDEAMKKLPRPVIQSLLCQSSEEFDEQNPLHIAAENENHKMVKIILDLYRSSASSSEAQSTTETNGEKPWLGLDNDGSTPLHRALLNCNGRIALEILSMDVESLSSMEDSEHRGPLFIAMQYWLYRVALQILTSAANYSLNGDSGQTALFVAADAPETFLTQLLEAHPEFMKESDYEEVSILHSWIKIEENGKLIVEKWPELINDRDKDGQTPLEIASKKGASWLVELILQNDRSWILETPLAWVQACEGGHLSTILAFAYKSSNFKDLCRLHRDTPLHHIQGVHYKDYKALIDHELIKEMKNIQNTKGETPLHVAIKRKNIELAEILLKMDGVDRTIKDNSKKTAMDLLQASCERDGKWIRFN